MKTFTITELASLTSVPPASIHYYLKQHLLPAPAKASPKRFIYDDRHVHGLRLIRTLRHRRRLPLAEIRRIMPQLLYLQEEEAFRAELWDKALAPSRRRHPAQRILTAAKEAFVRRGYSDVNVDEICEAAHVAKGSFYRHYRSKEALFFATIRSVTDDALAKLSGSIAGTGPMGAEAAGVALAAELRPSASLFLELLARSLQGRTADAAVAAELFTVASGEIGRLVRGAGSVEKRGSRAIGAGIALVLRSALEPQHPPAPQAAWKFSIEQN